MTSGRALRVAAWPADSNRWGNPYNHLLASGLRERGVVVEEFSPRRCFGRRYDVVHVHWPEWVLDAEGGFGFARRAGAVLGALDRARRRGARVVWTVHNLGAHERGGGRASRLAWRIFLRRVDGFISLTGSGVDAARARLPALAERPGFVVPHGHYRGAYPDTASRDEARRSLGLGDRGPVALFFGNVRPYKGVAELVDVFRRVGRSDAALVVAGRPLDDAVRRTVVAAAGDDPRVHLHLGFLPDDEVQRYFRAADLVVLPYLETFNSGAALLALSFDRPVLAPGKGAFVELARDVGAGWVRMYDAGLTADRLESALTEAAATGGGSHAPLDAYSWEAVAELTLDAYRAVIAAHA